MSINPYYIAIVVVGFAIALFLYVKGRTLVGEVKLILFTPASVAVAIMYATMLCGFLSMWMFFNVQVLGNDVAFSMPSSSGIKGKLHE